MFRTGEARGLTLALSNLSGRPASVRATLTITPPGAAAQTVAVTGSVPPGSGQLRLGYTPRAAGSYPWTLALADPVTGAALGSQQGTLTVEAAASTVQGGTTPVAGGNGMLLAGGLAAAAAGLWLLGRKD